jgi:hypothetical protein
MALCTPWISGDEVADCCSVETSSGAIFDEVAEQASELLFTLSARQFPGECSKTVRPACHTCFCGYQILSRGHIVGPWDWGYPLAGLCDLCLVSCNPSLVKLSGYPVQEITQITIDGDILNADLYRIYQHRYLQRLDDGRWPIQQDLTQPATEDGTFSVEYTYGASPPALGQAAAAQLACELYKECSGQTCALPKGTTRVTRQGITIDRLAFTSWAFLPASRARSRPSGWNTGLPLVDSFLNTYNSSGLMRRPVLYAPGKRPYAQPWG